MTAAERLKDILADKVKGYRGPTHNRVINGIKNQAFKSVQVCRDDILEVCEAIKTKTQIVEDLMKGANWFRPGSMVIIKADDAFHLLEEYEKSQ
jgi:hypothetical protein